MNNSTSTIKHRVQPTAILNNRVAFAYIDGIAVNFNDVPKWSGEMVFDWLEQQNKLANGLTSLANISRFYDDFFNATQRRQIMDWMNQKGFSHAGRTILITESSLLRAALTAYSFLTKTSTKAFAPNEIDAMCQWVTEGTNVNPADVKAAVLGCYRVLGKKATS